MNGLWEIEVGAMHDIGLNAEPVGEALKIQSINIGGPAGIIADDVEPAIGLGEDAF